MTAPAHDIRPDAAGALAAALGALGRALEEGRRPDPAVLRESRVALLAERFSLDASETLAVGLLAGAALSPAFAAALDRRAEWGAVDLGPVGVLRAWHLVRPVEGGIALDARILDWLKGSAASDARLDPWVLDLHPAEQLLERHAAQAEALAAAMLQAPGPLAVTGSGRKTRARVAVLAAGRLDMRPLGLDAAIFAESPERRAMLVRLVAREVVLDRRLPVFQVEAIEPALGGWLHRLKVPSLTLAQGGPGLDADAPPATRLEPPTLGERAALWRAALGLDRAEDALPVAEPFVLDPDEIAAIAARVPPGPDRVGAACAEAVRALRPASDPLVRSIEPRARWSDLVLPPQTEAALRAVAAQARNGHEVFGRWGFGASSPRGRGLTALFCGPSGTGKTLAAEVLAADLGRGLLRVDLSQVVDKYLGETEKHLDRVFDLADRSGAVLLFDEAEALFRQRGDDDAGARHFVSMTVSYLLQRLETCTGTCLLTTNMRSAIDAAFLRRLRFVVPFAFPGLAERRRLWQALIPPGAPCAGLDLDALAALPIAGGAIRTVALNAAFLAADRGEAIGMAHVAGALELENAKLDQPVDVGALRRRARR